MRALLAFESASRWEPRIVEIGDGTHDDVFSNAPLVNI